MKDIHVTLADETVREVDDLARLRRETRNAVIRRALENYLEAERHRRIADEMRSYAQQMAGHSDDIVRQTGPMVTRKLLEETEW